MAAFLLDLCTRPYVFVVLCCCWWGGGGGGGGGDGGGVGGGGVWGCLLCTRHMFLLFFVVVVVGGGGGDVVGVYGVFVVVVCLVFSSLSFVGTGRTVLKAGRSSAHTASQRRNL